MNRNGMKNKIFHIKPEIEPVDMFRSNVSEHYFTYNNFKLADETAKKLLRSRYW